MMTLEKEKEMLRMKQQENAQRLRIVDFHHQVRWAENEISQNGSEKLQNWLHNSFCDDIGSRISDTAEDGRRNEKDAVVKSLCDVTKLQSDTIGVQRQIEMVSEYLRRFPQRFVEIFG
jgi:hypothetical protein